MPSIDEKKDLNAAFANIPSARKMYSIIIRLSRPPAVDDPARNLLGVLLLEAHNIKLR